MKYSHQHPLHIIMQTHLRIDIGDVGCPCIALLRERLCDRGGPYSYITYRTNTYIHTYIHTYIPASVCLSLMKRYQLGPKSYLGKWWRSTGPNSPDPTRLYWGINNCPSMYVGAEITKGSQVPKTTSRNSFTLPADWIVRSFPFTTI